MNKFKVFEIECGDDLGFQTYVMAEDFTNEDGLIVFWTENRRVACFPALKFFVTQEPDEPTPTT